MREKVTLSALRGQLRFLHDALEAAVAAEDWDQVRTTTWAIERAAKDMRRLATQRRARTAEGRVRAAVKWQAKLRRQVQEQERGEREQPSARPSAFWVWRAPPGEAPTRVSGPYESESEAISFAKMLDQYLPGGAHVAWEAW